MMSYSSAGRWKSGIIRVEQKKKKIIRKLDTDVWELSVELDGLKEKKEIEIAETRTLRRMCVWDYYTWVKYRIRNV